MSSDPTPERTLVISCPDWPVTAAGYTTNQPVAVVEGGRVVAASSAARHFGVRPYLRRRDAESRCSHLVLVPRDYGVEIRAFEPVAVALEKFGALVAVGHPGWVACTTRGPARYFGGEETFAFEVGRAVDALSERLGVSVNEPSTERTLVGSWWRVGIADGPFAATIAAQLGCIVPPGASRDFLAPFDVEFLGREELAAVLRRLGVSTLGAFGALDEADVSARFGEQGAQAHRLARGLDGRTFGLRRRAVERTVERTVDPPATTVDATAFLAKHLAGQLADDLAADGLACTLLEIAIETSTGERFSRRWSHDGAWRPTLVAERLRWQLETWLLDAERPTPTGETTEPVGIVRVELTPVEVIADVGQQLELWGRQHGDDDRAMRAFARVQGMLGADGAVFSFLVGGRGPKEQVCFVPAGDPLPRGGGHENPWPGRLPLPNPAAVFVEPTPGDLFDATGQRVGVDGRGMPTAAPATIVVGRAAPVPIVAWAGPWPVDERWWDRGAHQRRARFQVLSAHGDAYLVALERGRFFVEGTYD